MENDMSIGILNAPDRLCGSVGDTLGLTAIIEKLYEEKKEKIVICTPNHLSQLFYNNPYVKNVIDNSHPSISISPCGYVACNIIHNYAKQINIELSKDTKPKIYLTDDEIEYGKNILKEFDGFKKIAISTETGGNSKNLKCDYISPLFNRLKQQGYKLIGVGAWQKQKHYNYDISFIGKTTYREVFSIINACDLFLGVDCGLFHAAAALDIPQVIFFRNNLSSNNKYSNTFFIESNIKCQGVCLNNIPDCPALVKCMDSFDLNEYFLLINKIMMK